MKIHELKDRTVGICVSGGLDSKTITKKLVEEGVRVVCFSADLAQPDEPDIQNIAKKMEPCGAETILVDLKSELLKAKRKQDLQFLASRFADVEQAFEAAKPVVEDRIGTPLLKS